MVGKGQNWLKFNLRDVAFNLFETHPNSDKPKPKRLTAKTAKIAKFKKVFFAFFACFAVQKILVQKASI